MERHPFKECSVCHEIKPQEEYHFANKPRDIRKTDCKNCSSKRIKAYREANPDKVKAWKKAYAERHPDRVRARNNRWRRGKLHPEYVRLVEIQGGVCYICGNPETRGPNYFLSWDHDHATGLYRGLLCNRCNIVLGHVKDDTEILLNMVRYINEWKKNHLVDGDLNFNQSENAIG